MVHNFQICTYNPSTYRSQTIVVWMVKPLSTVSKHCAYMLNTDFIHDMQLRTLNLCGLYFLPSHFSTWSVITAVSVMLDM